MAGGEDGGCFFEGWGVVAFRLLAITPRDFLIGDSGLPLHIADGFSLQRIRLS